MTADIGPVVKAVEQAVITRLNVTRPMRRIFGDEVADALEVLLVQETHAAAAEVAKAAMDAARPIIDAEAADAYAAGPGVSEHQEPRLDRCMAAATGRRVDRHRRQEQVMPAHATAQVEVIKCPACKNPIVAHMTYGMTLNDDRMETITDPAEIRATDDPDERTTPAPVGAAVALDLDAARAMLNAANTIKATGGAVEIGGVRIEPCDEYGSTVTTARAEAAEAEVVTLRARLAAVESLADEWADRKRSDGMSGNAWIGLTLSGVAADLRAALATTGEGQ